VLSQFGDLWVRRLAKPVSANEGGLKPSIVITGASRGIGFELARAFSADRKPLLLIARTIEGLEKAAAQLRAEKPIDIHVLATDLTEPEAVAHIDEALQKAGLYCDVLINNAAMGLSGKFSSMGQDEINKLVALNVATLTQTTHHFLKPMLARGRGGILNVASLGGLMPGPYQAAYYASKAYVISLTEALAAEHSGEGVRICALAPGPVETQFHAAMGAESALYRKLLPAITAERAARAGHFGYHFGRRLIVPNISYQLASIASRLLPRPLLTALISFLLKPHD
jgi:uncharacterized protein